MRLLSWSLDRGAEIMELSDEALVLGCRRGDEEAWAALINRYRRLVYAIPRRAGLDEDLASDVFQRVFTVLLERLDQIEQPARVSAWLVTIAKRESWRVSRQHMARSAHRSSDDLLETDEPPDGGLLPEEVLLRLEEQNAVRVAVEALDDRCRNLLDLLFYRSLSPSYEEIARALGLREGSIGPTRARCLERLRRVFESGPGRS